MDYSFMIGSRAWLINSITDVCYLKNAYGGEVKYFGHYDSAIVNFVGM